MVGRKVVWAVVAWAALGWACATVQPPRAGGCPAGAASSIAPTAPGWLHGRTVWSELGERDELGAEPRAVATAAATLRIFSVDRDATLRAQPQCTTHVDALGRFVVVAPPPPGELLLRVEGPQGFGLAIAMAPDGAAVTSPMQLDARSTLAAQIYLTARRSGLWPHEVGAEHVQALLGAKLARATLHGGRRISPDISVLARATAAAARAWQAEMHPSASPTLAPLQRAAAAQATAETFELVTRLLSGAAQAQAIVDMEVLRAFYVTGLVETTLLPWTKPGVQGDTRRQGVQLLTRIAHAAQTYRAPSAVRSCIHKAWLDYQEQLDAALRLACAGIDADYARQLQRAGLAASSLAERLALLDAGGAPQTLAATTSIDVADLLHDGAQPLKDTAGQAPAPVALVLGTLSNLAMATR